MTNLQSSMLKLCVVVHAAMIVVVIIRLSSGSAVS